MRLKAKYFYKLLKKYLYVPVLFVFVFFILNINLNTGVPARDSGVFLYVGNGILDGKIPFSDYWDHKPPLVYFLNALVLFIGNNSLSFLWLFEFIFLFVSAVLNFKLLTKLFGNVAGVIGTAILLIMFGGLIQGGNQIEEYAFLFQLAILHIFISIKKDKVTFLPYVFIGVLSGIIFLIKQNIIAIVLSISIIALYEGVVYRKFRVGIKKIFYLSLGVLPVLCVLAIYFVKHNALNQLIDQAFLYNFIYSKTPIQQKIFSSIQYFKIFPPYSILIIIGYTFGLIDLYKNKMSTLNIIRLNSVVFPLGLILVGASGRSYFHYYISLLPISALLIGQFIYLFPSFINKASRKYLKTKLNIGLIVTIFIIAPFIFKDTLPVVTKNLSLTYRLMGKDLKLRTFRFNNFAEHQDTIDIINQNTSGDEYVLIYGAESAINFITNRESPSKYFYQYPLFTPNYTTVKMIDNFIIDIKSKNTKLIIDASLSTADKEAGEGYIVAPINVDERQRWYDTNKNTHLFDKYEEFFDYVKLNYDEIGTTYHGKWVVYKKGN